jgi:hypothetical protein
MLVKFEGPFVSIDLGKIAYANKDRRVKIREVINNTIT